MMISDSIRVARALEAATCGCYEWDMGIAP